jgi:disease resistance protein RPM1
MTMDFLHKVESPPRLLQYLKIHGYIDRMPDWVRSLTNLVELDIAWTYVDGAQLVHFLYRLPKMKRLSLGPYFMQTKEDMVVGSNQPFPELKELNLRYAHGGIPSGYRFEEGSMPKLEKLVVQFGDQGKSLVGVEHMTSLKEVQYIGHRVMLKDAVEKLEEINMNRDALKKIAGRLTYWD